MGKELEALDTLYYSWNVKKLEQAYKFLKEYLKSIDNSNPSEAIVEKSLKALEILKRNMKVSIEYGVEKRDISCALVFYIDNKKTIYVVDEAIKEQSPEHFKELELLKEVLE